MKSSTAMKTDTSEAEKDLSLKPTACHEYVSIPLTPTPNLPYYKATIVHNVMHLDTKLGDTSTARKVMCNESHYSSSVLNRYKETIIKELPRKSTVLILYCL